MEKIGQVHLDFEFYSGSDLYSDGDIEEVILDIVRENETGNYEKIIKQTKSWPILYHLSDVRKNIINWYPFKKGADILEIGAGCGAITAGLTENDCNVTAVDLSKRRSLINAYRNREKQNLQILVGNFNDVAEGIQKEFDYVTLIGVLEYAGIYIPGKNSADMFLEKIYNLLKANGRLIIAIENQMGLKYFAGCKEDHVGKFFEGIEGYPTTDGIQTYSKKALQSLLERNSFAEIEFYYPYPDYKFPDRIYSDEMLPQKGELVENARNFDAPRMNLFDESKVWNTVIEAGMFPEMSNSFLVIAKKRER